MDAFINMLQSLVPENFDMVIFLKTALVLVVGFLVLGLIGRLLFGKKSVLNQSISSAIGILFIYAVTIVIHSFGLDLKFMVTPLPFITLTGDHLHIFSFSGNSYVAICGEVLNMVILALLVNLINNCLPKGKKLLTWLSFRLLSVLLAMLLHVFIQSLLTAFLPEGLLTWAPVILLGLLVLSLLLGALKVLVGAALATVNPIIGLLYTFFFSTLVGKQLSKAILTTLLLCALVLALNFIGCAAVYIGAAALAAFIPLLLVLLTLWYIIGRLL